MQRTAKLHRLFILVLLSCGCPSPLQVSQSSGGEQLDTAPARLRIMSWNVEWMYDDDPSDNKSELAREQSAPGPAYWRAKLYGVASVIAAEDPHIVALQEIEDRDTLVDLARALREEHDINYRIAFIPGTDTFTEQDVGLLVRSASGLVGYCRREQSYAMFSSGNYYNLSKHLIAHFRWENVDAPLVLMTVHLRATAEAADVRKKQLALARVWLEPYVSEGADVLLIGDLNTEEPVGSSKNDLAPLLGGLKPLLVDLMLESSNPNTPTHLILPRQFDRALGSPSLLTDGPGLDWQLESIRVVRRGIIRGRPDGEDHWTQRLKLPVDEFDLSDHFPIVVELRLQ